jgi:hypothetical protein
MLIYDFYITIDILIYFNAFILVLCIWPNRFMFNVNFQFCLKYWLFFTICLLQYTSLYFLNQSWEDETFAHRLIFDHVYIYICICMYICLNIIFLYLYISLSSYNSSAVYLFICLFIHQVCSFLVLMLFLAGLFSTYEGFFLF